ncbi:MAG TPA: TIGR02221 family CRISPR-associated protein, partial [Saprospiraceae bacterium]|nr:TIGR02221 family CRISPR-associated protein [Saprospiraceae bacterium]
GTGDYTPVKYQINELKPIESKYVQIASYQSLCKHFSNSDKILIFSTPTAFKTNWLDNGHKDKITKEPKSNIGLNNCFKKIGVHTDPIEIPEGKSESEIWKIFQTVYDQLEHNDEVYFDITHSLRSIPMLNMVLINYAKLLKEITVKGIFYGAFEVESEIKPIWDLTSFSELQDWTLAAAGFIHYGQSKGIKDLAHQEVMPILRNGYDENLMIAKEFFQLAKSIDAVTDALATNRGNEIVEGKIFENLKNNIENISNITFIPPFKPIIELIEQKTSWFNSDKDIMNGFRAVEWCIEHNLLQQGYTMLQENIFTYYCHIAGLNYKNINDRKIVSDAFYAINNKLKNDDPKVKLVQQLISFEMAKLYESLTQDRNDINHAGFKRANSADNLRNNLLSKWNKCKILLKLSQL